MTVTNNLSNRKHWKRMKGNGVQKTPIWYLNYIFRNSKIRSVYPYLGSKMVKDHNC